MLPTTAADRPFIIKIDVTMIKVCAYPIILPYEIEALFPLLQLLSASWRIGQKLQACGGKPRNREDGTHSFNTHDDEIRFESQCLLSTEPTADHFGISISETIRFPKLVSCIYSANLQNFFSHRLRKFEILLFKLSAIWCD